MVKVNWNNYFGYILGIAHGISTFEFVRDFKSFKKRFKPMSLFYEEDEKDG